MLRSVFGLDLIRAKELYVVANYGVSSLSEYQETLSPALLHALDEMDAEFDSPSEIETDGDSNLPA